MAVLQTNRLKLAAKRLTRSAVPIRPNAVIRRLVGHALGQSVHAVSEIKGGEINRVFRVVTSQGVVIARTQFFRDYTSIYRHEREMMESARQLGILAPTTIAIGRWHTHSYMIIDYVEPHEFVRVDSTERWRQLGTIARKLSVRPWPTTPEKWNKYVESTVRNVTHDDLIVKSGVLSRDEFELAVSRIAELAAIRMDRVFQHGDLKLENMIVDERGQYWLLDWASAGGYPKHYSLVQVYGCVTEAWQFDAFRDGYGVSEDEWGQMYAELRPLIVAFLLKKIFWQVRSELRSEVLWTYVARLRTTLYGETRVMAPANLS